MTTAHTKRKGIRLLQTRSSIWPAIGAGLVLIALVLFYLSTLARGLTWANYGVDGGDLIAAAATRGIAHPPGYPTYLLMGQLFLLVPFGDLAARMSLYSALTTAAAVGIFSLIIAKASDRSFFPRWAPAALAGLAFGLAPIPWSQAVITEVHGLNLLFVVLALGWIYVMTTRQQPSRWILGLSFAVGLGLGNHLTMLLMLLPMLLVLVQRWRADKKRRGQLIGIAAALAAGLLVYLYLPIQARSNPPINWGNPQDLDGFLWTVTGKPYQGLAFALPLEEIPRRIAAWAGLMLEGFGPVGLTLGVIGFFFGISKVRALDRTAVWMLGSYSIFALGYNTADSIEYLIPAQLGFTWGIALGLNATIGYLGRSFSILNPWGMGIVPAILLASLVFRTPGIMEKVDASDDLAANEYGLSVMREAPEEAVILTWQAMDSFPLWYYQHALNMRPDLAVIVVPLMQFDWYLEQLAVNYPNLSLPDEELIRLDSPDLISPPEHWDRPVCFLEMSAGEELNLILVCPDLNT